MTHSLADFEQRRQAIAQQVAQLGDLRAASITSTSARCGKPGCRCHQPGQPAHGPHLRLTYKVDGKTVSESLPTPAAIHKAEREVAQFRKFQQLTRELVETTAALTELLRFPAPANEKRAVACLCGQQAQYRELRAKPVLTAVGRVQVSRPYDLCARCHAGPFPADVELDIEHTECSPGVRRMNALVGQGAPFDRGRQQMKLLADREVATKTVERTAEVIGDDIAQGEPREIQRAIPSAIRIPPSTSALSKALKSLVSGSMGKPGIAAGAARRKKLS